MKIKQHNKGKVEVLAKGHEQSVLLFINFIIISSWIDHFSFSFIHDVSFPFSCETPLRPERSKIDTLSYSLHIIKTNLDKLLRHYRHSNRYRGGTVAYYTQTD